ncbi:MAG: diguanylate cyclase [Candidatus Firestonebacteria bacterium]|nr:diguanylate cyclase [Candidatus Firestonebacteria bacterium]
MNKRYIRPSDYTIIIIDDDEMYAKSVHIILEREGYHAIICSKREEVAEAIKKKTIQIILLDYFMPGVSPEEIIQQVRREDQNIQIILQTGYAKEIPALEIMKRLDIQGYHDKNDGPEKMLMLIELAAKFYHHLNALERSKEGLRYILKITPLIYKMQSLHDLLKGTLLQIIGLLDGEHGFLAILGLGYSMLTWGDFLEYQVGVGKFANKNCFKELDNNERELIEKSISKRQIESAENILIVPIILRDKVLGIIFIETYKDYDDDKELLMIFANQIAIAIENTILYELATIDSLTKLYVKGYFIQRLREEMRSSYRYNYPSLILILDIDYFKNVNDSYGHQFGDYILAEVSQIIKNSTRQTDIACRYGGDEFAVILPHTDRKGGIILAERIKDRIHDKEFNSPKGEKIHISISIGISSMAFDKSSSPSKIIRSDDFFENICYRFISEGDKALYTAKNSGRNKVCESEPIIIEDK